MRTLGKRVWGNPPRVRISPPPQPSYRVVNIRAPETGRFARLPALGAAARRGVEEVNAEELLEHPDAVIDQL